MFDAPNIARFAKEETPLQPWLNQIHQGDCLHLMRAMPKKTVDLIVTSPPYNIKNSTGNGLKCGKGGKWANAALIKGYADHHDNMPHDAYVAWQRDCLHAMLDLLKDSGAIFYNHKWRVQNGLLQDRQDIMAGLPVRQIIIWKRNGGINFNRGYFLPTYEIIYLIAKPQFKLAPKANAQGDVWEIPQTRDNPHPAPFPMELAEKCIAATEAQIVLDPFMGSGTTAAAAKNLGRAWIGMDISHDYCRMARERLH